MKRCLFALALMAAGVIAGSPAFAAMGTKAAIPNTPLPSEVAFVKQVTQDLNARFPSPAQAEQAGYFRYNNEDSTGAISYANLQWNSAADPAHPLPSQLWYDVKGRLIGADFSVPLTASNGASPPKLWGLNPARWFKFSHPHVHYVLTGTTNAAYGHAVRASAFTAAGGDLSNPTAATLVKMGKVKNADRVVKVFTFPAQWDTELWLVPNPLGVFAEKNPLVHPSASAGKPEM